MVGIQSALRSTKHIRGILPLKELELQVPSIVTGDITNIKTTVEK